VSLAVLLQSVLAPARETGREMALDVMVGAAAFGLAMTGAGFLIAAAFWLLVAAVGHPAAAAIVGVILIGLAAVIVLVRQTRRLDRQRRLREAAVVQAAVAQAAAAQAAAAQAAARDPLPSLVFDLAFMAGRQFLARRRR